MLDMMQASCESRSVHHTHKSEEQWRNRAQTRSTQQIPGGPLTDRCMSSTSTHLSTTSREGRAGLSGGGRIEPFHLGTCSSSTTTCVCPGRGGFQMALSRPWKALWEGQAIHRVIPDESEQKIPCTKGASRTLFCDHMTRVVYDYSSSQVIYSSNLVVFLHVCLVFTDVTWRDSRR